MLTQFTDAHALGGDELNVCFGLVMHWYIHQWINLSWNNGVAPARFWAIIMRTDVNLSLICPQVQYFMQNAHRSRYFFSFNMFCKISVISTLSYILGMYDLTSSYMWFLLWQNVVTWHDCIFGIVSFTDRNILIHIHPHLYITMSTSCHHIHTEIRGPSQ